MAIIDTTNGNFRSLGLPRVVTKLFVDELGWHRPLDMFIFLRHVYDYRVESRASNVQAIENKLRRTNGFGPERIKKVIDVLIAHDII